MATIWGSGPDDATPPAGIEYGGEAFSTQRVLVAIFVGCLAVGALGLALVGALGWNRFGDHLSPLVYVAVLCAGAGLVAVRWETARRAPTGYVVLALVATAVYLEVAYGDLADWDRLVPSRASVSEWVSRNHRALSTALVLMAFGVGVRSRRGPGRS